MYQGGDADSKSAWRGSIPRRSVCGRGVMAPGLTRKRFGRGFGRTPEAAVCRAPGRPSHGSEPASKVAVGSGVGNPACRKTQEAAP